MILTYILMTCLFISYFLLTFPVITATFPNPVSNCSTTYVTYYSETSHCEHTGDVNTISWSHLFLLHYEKTSEM